MGDLFNKVLRLSSGGLVGKEKRKPLSSAKRQAKKVGATVGKPSEKAREASGREFASPSISNLLGGVSGPGLGSSAQNYRNRPLKRTR